MKGTGKGAPSEASRPGGENALLTALSALCMLLILPSAQALADEVGPPIHIGGEAIYGPAVFDQESPAVAFDGTNYLVVWEDTRGDSRDIYGARVSSSGAVPDSNGVPLCSATADQHSPAVAFDGSDYLVVWDDLRNGIQDVYATRVDTASGVRDPAGIPVSTAGGGQFSTAIAFDGKNFLIVWDDNRGSSYDIYGARVDTAGTVVDPDGIAVSTTGNSQLDAAAAFGANRYLVVWEDERGDSAGIRAAQVDVSGAVLNPEGTAVCSTVGPQNDPAVAFDGMNYLTVWADYRGGPADIYGARVDTLGGVLDPGGFPVSSATYDQRDPAIAFDGTNYLVVWTDYRDGLGDVYAARVSPSGTVLDPAGLLISDAPGTQREPAIAFSGEGYLRAWEDSRNVSWDVYGARVDTSGAVRDTAIAVSLEPGDQSSPAAAFDGTNCLVVWEDRRSGLGWDIYAARVDTSGAVLDATGIAVSAAAGDQLSPAAAFSEMGYLVAWDDRRAGVYSDVYAARLSMSGTVLDPDGVAISGAAFAEHRPAVASGPVCALLVAYDSFTRSPYGVCRIWGNIWSGPTVVTFASATATAEGGCVRLSWQTGVQVPAESFVIERSDSRVGGFRVLDLRVSQGPGVSFGCTDDTVLPDHTYWYRIRLTGIYGEEICGPLEVSTAPAPIYFRLHQSYPNPFNPICTIRYEIPRRSKVLLRVFDVRGSVVRTLLDGWKNAGAYSQIWDGRGERGQTLPSGVYFCSLETAEFSSTRKTVLLR